MINNQPKEPARPLASEKVMLGHKVFFLDLKENHRGRVIKITEDVNGRRDTIMMPIEAATNIAEALERLISVSEKMN
jgi:hypothetical protein